jgi:site-specific DNA recombinase
MPKSILANGIPTQQGSRQTDTPKIAAIYARVSTTDQADKGYSLPTQIDACQRLAQQYGYTVPESHVFVDDYTGTSLNRPQFTMLRDLVQQRLVQAVIVHDMDRLSRKLAHQLLLSEEFEQAGLTLHIVTMPDGAKTPETQLLAHVRGIIAEYERAKILERTARGRVGRAKAGFVPSGQHTLGYTIVKHVDKGAHYAVHPEEAALVQRLIEQMELETSSLMEYCVRMRSQLQHFTLEEKQLALEALNITVVWHPEKTLEIRGSIPVSIVSNAPDCIVPV